MRKSTPMFRSEFIGASIATPSTIRGSKKHNPSFNRTQTAAPVNRRVGRGKKMKVKDIIRALKKENKELDVYIFDHDHDPENPANGCGAVYNVREIIDHDGKKFVAIQA